MKILKKLNIIIITVLLIVFVINGFVYADYDTAFFDAEYNTMTKRTDPREGGYAADTYIENMRYNKELLGQWLDYLYDKKGVKTEGDKKRAKVKAYSNGGDAVKIYQKIYKYYEELEKADKDGNNKGSDKATSAKELIENMNEPTYDFMSQDPQIIQEAIDKLEAEGDKTDKNGQSILLKLKGTRDMQQEGEAISKAATEKEAQLQKDKIYKLAEKNSNGSNPEDIDGIIDNANGILEGNEVKYGDDLKSFVGILYNIALVIGVLASVIVGGILGVKYMTASVEGKAEIKSMLLPYAVGCAVVFGAFGIWKLVLTLLEGL